MVVRSSINKRPIVQKTKSLKKKSSSEIKDIALDYRRTDWSGKPLGRTKRQRKPAEMEMNRRYRKGRQSVDHFHPESFAYSELESIAKGRGCEAWSFVMRRNDVPQKAREMARKDIARRDAARGKK